MSLRTRLAALLSSLFGSLSWQPPKWLKDPGNPDQPKLRTRVAGWLKAKRRPLGVLVLVALAGGGGYRWYTTRPIPPPPPDLVRLSASLTAPTPPPKRLRTQPEASPEPLRVRFDGSAAPLDRIGKDIDGGVALSPAVDGTFAWTDERTLTFTPKQHWPIGQAYELSLSESLVSRPNLELMTKKLPFRTDAFTVSPASLEFYQDPVDPSVKQVVGTYRFNYPVDPQSFEQRLSLTSHPDSNTSQVATHRTSVAYDDFGFEAYVRSESLPLPLENHTAKLTLAKGVVAKAGSAPVDEAFTNTVRVPGKGSRFRINRAHVSIVPDAKGDPDQVLLFDCTSDVNELRFAQAVKAWVLPVDRPAEKGRKKVTRYGWSNPAEVGPEVLKLSQALPLNAIPGERELGRLQSFKFDTKPGARIFLRVEAGLEAFGGYVLLKTYETIVTVPEYPRELRLAHEGAVLSVSGDKKLTVVSRGIPGFQVQLFRIQNKDLNHLVTQSGGDFAHLSMNGSLREENIAEVFREVQKLDASNPRVAQYAAVDFGPYLGTATEQKGLFFVRVQAWDPKTNRAITQYSSSDAPPPPQRDDEGEDYESVDREDEGDGYDGEGEGDGYDGDDSGGDYDEGRHSQVSDKRFVLLTDLGVIDKVDAHQQHWVFVQSFRSGQPVAGARVQVLSKNGSIALERTTDAGGVVTLPALGDLSAEKAAVALVVRNQGDTSFLPLNRSDRTLDLSRFDVGGVRTRGKAAALTAYAFSDRGLYRPGETAHLATLVRAVDWSKATTGVPLELLITDPRGLTVKRKPVALDAAGFATLDFTPEDRAPTGTYTFVVRVAEPNRSPVLLGSTAFRVEEFQPDRMRMTTRFETRSPGWVTTQQLKALVELRNLYGTPAAGHEVRASFTLTPYSPSFSKFPDYRFHDPARAQRSEDRRLPDDTTGDDGNASFDVDLSSWAPATYQVSFYAEGFELGGGRGVSSVASIIVSPRKYLLGFKADGNLGFIKRGTPRTVHVLAVDPKLETVAVAGLKAVVVEQRTVSVLTRQSNGSYRYQSVVKDVTKRTDKLEVTAKGLDVTLPSEDVGRFYLSVRDAEDIELLRIGYTIAGDANLARDLERNAELKVSLDKGQYEPGETVKLQITAPYAGSGVITIERDKVYVHKPFTTETSNTVQTIEVPMDLEANGYINVAFIRALNSPELFVSPLSYGVVPFKVLRKGQHLDLDITAPKLARPGRPIELTYRTDKPSRVVVWAVDEGILQVANYRTPDPLEFFLARRALEVSTRQIVDQLLPEYSLVKARGQEGGDDDAEGLARNLNPFKRKADAPAVFWSGLLDAGPEAKTVTFTAPESFAGSLRVMAVAAAPDAMAATQTTSIVRGPFVIAPNVPTFLSPKDTLTVTAAIGNNVEGSGDTASLTVKLTPNEGLVVKGPATRTLTVAEGREGLVSFDVTATTALGDGALRFDVSGAGQEGSRTAHVSIRPPTPYLSTAQLGSLKDGKKELKVTRAMYDKLATRTLSLSLLPLSLGVGAADYLENYPHLCSEQLSSRAAPALIFLKRPEWGADVKKAHAAVDRAFDVLRARQNAKGGFGYWAANSFESEPLNVAITLMLTEARDRGITGPNDVRLKALQRLKKQVEVPAKDLGSARLNAQALYVLARNDVVMPAQTAQVAELLGRLGKPAEQDVAHAFLAATFKLTNNADKGDAVMAKLEPPDEVAADAKYFHGDTVAWSQHLYLLSKHFPARLNTVGPKLLERLTKSLTGGLHSLSAAWSLYGLDAYATAAQGLAPGGALSHVTLEAQDETGQWKQQVLSGTLSTTVAYTASVKAFRLRAGPGPMVFYALTEGGFDLDVPTTAIQEGIELIHTLVQENGQPATSVNLGDEVYLKVQARALSKFPARQMAIVDLLPSGFEVVLSRGSNAQGLGRLSTQSANFQPEELDAREDRVLFYGTLDSTVRQVTYKVKAVARGSFVVPPAHAVGMYDPKLVARSLGARVEVK